MAARFARKVKAGSWKAAMTAMLRQTDTQCRSWGATGRGCQSRRRPRGAAAPLCASGLWPVHLPRQEAIVSDRQ